MKFHLSMMGRILLAFLCYAAGFSLGIGFFFLVGVVFEGMFLVRLSRQRNSFS